MARFYPCTYWLLFNAAPWARLEQHNEYVSGHWHHELPLRFCLPQGHIASNEPIYEDEEYMRREWASRKCLNCKFTSTQSVQREEIAKKCRSRDRRDIGRKWENKRIKSIETEWSCASSVFISTCIEAWMLIMIGWAVNGGFISLDVEAGLYSPPLSPALFYHPWWIWIVSQQKRVLLIFQCFSAMFQGNPLTLGPY